jgi:hypothetical protein
MSTQNIIQGIVSPKVVSDGSGGYKVSADLVNVDTANISKLNISAIGDTSTGTADIGLNVNGHKRWEIGHVTGDPNDGTNTGSSLYIKSYSDNGTYQYPVVMNRRDNTVTINNSILNGDTTVVDGILQVNQNLIMRGNVNHYSSQCGKVKLSNGTASITNASITSSSVILLTPIGSSTGNPVTQYSVNVLNNTGFNIYSSNISDTSYVNWFIAKF